MKLGSPEYLKEVKRRSNADETYCKMIQNDDESNTLVLQAEPSKGVHNPLVIGFQVDHGQIDGLYLLCRRHWAMETPLMGAAFRVAR